MPHKNPGNSVHSFLAGGGKMGEMIRATDWSQTSLGDPALWPSALKPTVSMMLTIRFPVLICWGNDFIQFYNDAFRPINGESKHPKALGGSARDTYAEIWETIGSMFKNVMNGETFGFPDFKVPLDRNGMLEDCYFDFSYSPIRDEDGNIGGVLVICVETTDKVHAMAGFKSMNEELESLNEELAASNEEHIAINEELAAVNEELAVTNEELVETQTRLQTANSVLYEREISLRDAFDDVARSERLFRSIAVNIPNSVVIVVDKDHKYVIVEGDLMDKLGYDRRNYEGKHPTELGQDQTARYLASKPLYDKMFGGEKFSLERRSATGQDFLVHMVPLKNENNEVYAGLIMALDITEIKKAEERSAKLAAIVDSSDDAIISKTLESVITSWNGGAERLFGYKAEEIIGETIYKLIPKDRQDEEPQILSRLKTGERLSHFETKRLTKDGRLIDVSITVSPVKDLTGNIIGLSKIARDITERKLDETRKNDFIGMASHELKTPLTSLTAILQVAHGRLKNSDDSFLAGAVEKANIQVKRMTAMINGFLNISRLEAGKILIEKQTFDLDQLLHELLDETKLIVSTHHFSFIGSQPVEIVADRDKITSVISNLVSNSVKYSPRGNMIQIELQVGDDDVIVGVKDEGMGIKPQDLEKIFDRYYRVENTDTRHISGFGIGLYLSAEIIMRHNGKIWAESEAGKGSTFYFSLPRI
jgi:PAS domain S-box-containing protein